MKGKKTIDNIAYWLVLIGALNWGLNAFFNYDIVMQFASDFSKWIYGAVGISAAWMILRKFKVIK